MALFIGNDLARGGILDLSEAQAAFSPWWDQLQVKLDILTASTLSLAVLHFDKLLFLRKLNFSYFFKVVLP